MLTRTRWLFPISLLLALGDAHAETIIERPKSLAYRFTVGEELVYELTNKEELLEDKEPTERRYETQLKWNVYPLRQNPDGSWRLVVRTRIAMLRFDKQEDSEGNKSDTEERHVRFENDFLGWCDLHSNGAYVKNGTMDDSYAFGFPPEAIFTPLSSDPTGWTAPAGGATYKLKGANTNRSATFTVSITKPTDANYQSTRSREVTFDLAKGRETQFVETTRADWSVNPWHRRTTYKLTHVESRSPDWFAKFSSESDVYFAELKRWTNARGKAYKARTAVACHELLAEARANIEQTKVATELPEVRAAFDGMLALHDREAEWTIEDAAEREELLAKPPVLWESKNLAGDRRALGDYRGKVLILDFWYRGCGHCIEALPKVKALYGKYKDRGVVVLGVNNDRNLEDAHHVVNEFDIPYESVRVIMSGPDEEPERRIDKEYKVSGWPTFIVLDQTGRVAEIVSGNAEDLVEHLSGVVDELLAKPAIE